MTRRRRLLPCLALLAASTVSTAASGYGIEDAGAALAGALRRELGLTRSAAEIQRGLEALDRERASVDYTTVVLDHASRESVRRLRAYDEVARAREDDARARARALYKLARGGAARLVFEDDATSSSDRVLRGRALRRVVRHDLDELAVHRRASRRATAEMVAAARELQALGALKLVETMQDHVLQTAGQAIDPALKEAHRQRRRHTRKASDRQRRVNAELLALVRRNWDELEHLQGLDGAAELVRPVPGPVTGGFGTYTDPVSSLPMNRNGVELRARRNAGVRAMAAGRVVLVSSMPGFQQVVVVEHGGGQYSLTGRLWRVTVAEGDAVEAGDPLGRVAPKAIDDGLGPTVYVELRHGERPVDPTPYLERAG